MSTKNKKMVIICEIYSRVVGYYRPVNQYNKSKQAEFWDRKTYDVNNSFKPKKEQNMV